ncbi:hypothetical protein GMMP15_150049 [Candidatus Magnetomoraceae bacterium gMMP-15]
MRSIFVIGENANYWDDYVTEQKVGEVLNSNRIIFYSLNINHRPESIDYNNLFDKQVKTILSLRGEIGENFAITHSNNDTIQTKEAVMEILSKIYNFSNNIYQALTDRIEGSSIKKIERNYGTNTTNYLKNIMNKYGLSDQEIKLSRLNQICEEGWVSKKSRYGEEQLEAWILIERTSMDELLGIMSGLFRHARRRNPRGLNYAVREVIKRATGDDIQANELISKYLERIYDIPFHEISTVLSYTINQLEEKFRSDYDFRKEFIKTIGKKYTLLQLVTEEKTADLFWNEIQLRWYKENLVDKKWWWRTTSGVSFAWIPMEYLP